MLQQFGVLPGEARAREMTDREYLWCALHLMLDDEARLARMCPACRAEATEDRCPVCGMPTGGMASGENDAFDEERYQRLKRGERID